MVDEDELTDRRRLFKEIGTEDGYGLQGWYCDPLNEAEVMEIPLEIWLLLLELRRE